MRHLLILATILTGLGFFPAMAQTADPYPASAPVRSEAGEIVSPDAAATDETAADAADAGQDEEMSPEDNAAALAAELAARVAELQSAGAAAQPVTLSAKLIDDGPIIPSGLVWRIFSADETTNGDVKIIDRSEQATAAFNLPPGEYLAQVTYGLAQASDTLVVTDAPQSHVLVLDAGALRLNARISGDLEIAPRHLKFEIYPQGLEDDPRSVITANVKPGELVHLNAGIYHVISRFGTVNAVAETDLRVDKGQLTDATLFHDAAQISFRLVSVTGGEAIADVDWIINDTDGNTVYRYSGTFPSAILAAGDYVVLAQRGGTVYNREFAVMAGPPQEIEVLTSF